MRSPIKRIFGVGGVVRKSSIIAKNTFVSSSDSIINNIYSNDWAINFYEYYSMILTDISGLLDC